jgi:hypothetical protein
MIDSKWSRIRQKWKQISNQSFYLMARASNYQAALKRITTLIRTFNTINRAAFYYNFSYLLKPCSFQYFIFFGDGAFPGLIDLEAIEPSSLPLLSTD